MRLALRAINIIYLVGHAVISLHIEAQSVRYINLLRINSYQRSSWLLQRKFISSANFLSLWNEHNSVLAGTCFFFQKGYIQYSHKCIPSINRGRCAG